MSETISAREIARQWRMDHPDGAPPAEMVATIEAYGDRRAREMRERAADRAKSVGESCGEEEAGDGWLDCSKYIEDAIRALPERERGMNDYSGAEVERLQEALALCMIGGNHLALHIGADHPPHTASPDDGLTHYGTGQLNDIWQCWRNIMRARDLRDCPTPANAPEAP